MLTVMGMIMADFPDNEDRSDFTFVLFDIV